MFLTNWKNLHSGNGVVPSFAVFNRLRLMNYRYLRFLQGFDGTREVAFGWHWVLLDWIWSNIDIIWCSWRIERTFLVAMAVVPSFAVFNWFRLTNYRYLRFLKGLMELERSLSGGNGVWLFFFIWFELIEYRYLFMFFTESKDLSGYGVVPSFAAFHWFEWINYWYLRSL